MFDLGFGFCIAIVEMQAAEAAREAKASFRREMLAKCPPEMRQRTLEAWAKQDEADEKYRIDERRHREMVEAIRSTRPSGFVYGLML